MRPSDAIEHTAHNLQNFEQRVCSYLGVEFGSDVRLCAEQSLLLLLLLVLETSSGVGSPSPGPGSLRYPSPSSLRQQIVVEKNMRGVE